MTRQYKMELDVPCGPEITLCENVSINQIKERLRTLLMDELYSTITKIDEDFYKYIKFIFPESSLEFQLLQLVIFSSTNEDLHKNLLYDFLWDSITKRLEEKLSKIFEEIGLLDYEQSIKKDLILNYKIFIKCYSDSKPLDSK